MDCNEARPLLSAAIDRELSAAEALRVQRHVSTCAECQREAQALEAISRVTRAADYFRAPDALRERIVAALPVAQPAHSTQGEEAVADATKQAQPQTQTQRHAQPSRPEQASEPSREAHTPHDERRRPGSLGWLFGAWRAPRGARAGAGAGAPSSAFGWPMGAAFAAFAAIAAIALATSVALVAHRSGSAGTAFVDELVESHVRAQLSGHDTDVVSSDQHTVKPWFNGRLDYAPPVEDLAADGFALTGGRLDYVGHRRVAVLVYRYRKHIIDVYVMPQTPQMPTAAGTAPAALTSDGYALASWRAHGMLWWAVSDAEPAVLARLRVALTARLARPPTGPLQ